MKTDYPVPYLTQYDPAESGEGSIDPLGMYAIADDLAVRLAPGVRERQKRPRFLTLMAVSSAVVQDFPEDAVARDGHSEPWLVFEWHVVEGLVRAIPDRDALTGLPGVEKAQNALQKSIPLSASNYLKTPSVFGFHGIYRRLAHQLKILRDGYLDDVGYALLEVWEREQGQRGFVSMDGPGRKARVELRKAVEEGLRAGAVARGTSWPMWEWIRDHLYHRKLGREEARLITRHLMDAADGHRKPILEFLVSSQGQAVLEKCREENSERLFHEALFKQADSSLQEILHAILMYERFARLLQDAFDDCLYEMSLRKGKTSPAHLAQLPGVQAAVLEIPRITDGVYAALTPFEGLTTDFQRRFDALTQPLPALDWVVQLMEHHFRVQRQKPPRGKAPWCERFDDGAYIIRPAYYREEGGRHDKAYVHFYRTWSLQSFAWDLGLIHEES